MYQSATLENSGLTGMPPPVTVRTLLLDDSSFDRARIRRLSQKVQMPIQLDEVGSIEELDHAVNAEKYDLILIDYRLPIGDGMEALDHVLKTPKNRDAGKIMITGDGAVDTAVRAMRGGCHDFLSKSDMNAQMLSDAMQNAMTAARANTMSQVQYQHEMIRQGLIAALTDDTVTGNVVSLVKQQLQHTMPDRPVLVNHMDPSSVDALVTGFSEDDEFIFH